MKILDLTKQYKHLYQPSAKKIETVQVPSLQFAMIDGAIEKGHGPGNSPGFQKPYRLCMAFHTHSSSCSRNARRTRLTIP